MKRLIISLAISATTLLHGCAPATTALKGETVRVPAYSTTKRLRIYWVNEIDRTTDTLFKKSGWSALGELLIGKEPIRFYRPHGVHVDFRGRICVTDPDAHRVHLFDVQERGYRIIRSDIQNAFVSPIGVTSDEEDNLYITDSANGELYRYRITENRLEKLPTRDLKRPTGIAFDSFLNRLVVVDTQAHQVVVLNTEGKELYRFGSRGDHEGQFNYPTDITINRSGRILVNDALNSRIQVFAPDGKFLFAFGAVGDSPGNFARAKGIASDSFGAMYVSDALTDMIQVFDYNGRHIASFGRSGSAPGEFWMPIGLFVDQEDRLYAVDGYNRRIQMFEGLSDAAQETRSTAP